MLKANDVNQILKNVKDQLPPNVKVRGRVLEYKDFAIKFVFSKYGYDDLYGLDFFLRAENKNAKKDEWGNLLDPFNEANQIDFTADLLRLVPGSLAKLRGIYDTHHDNTLGEHFSAWNKEDLEKVIPLVVNACVAYIDKKFYP